MIGVWIFQVSILHKSLLCVLRYDQSDGPASVVWTRPGDLALRAGFQLGLFYGHYEPSVTQIEGQANIVGQVGGLLHSLCRLY